MAERRALRWTLVAVGLISLIVVPFVIWEAELQVWSEAWLVGAEGRVVVAFVVTLLLALDVLLPIPSSVVASLAVLSLGPVLGASAVWLGLTAGAALGYALGKSGGRVLVRRLVGERELERAERLATHFGSSVLVVTRGVPVLAEASSLLAGAFAMPLGRFALIVGCSNLGLALAYALLSHVGSSAGAGFVLPFALGVVVPALAWVLLRLVEKGRQR
jgi:3-dehydroquinate synthase